MSLEFSRPILRLLNEFVICWKAGKHANWKSVTVMKKTDRPSSDWLWTRPHSTVRYVIRWSIGSECRMLIVKTLNQPRTALTFTRQAALSEVCGHYYSIPSAVILHLLTDPPHARVQDPQYYINWSDVSWTILSRSLAASATLSDRRHCDRACLFVGWLVGLFVRYDRCHFS